MNQTHTPGPWQIAPDFPLHVLSEDGQTLARVRMSRLPANPQTYISEREAIANARLIAAAPDLLEALAKMVCAVNGIPVAVRQGITLASAMNVADEAIARARGG
jgi:hypothetical protein